MRTYTATEIAKLLGITKTEVYEKLSNGELALMNIFNVSNSPYRAIFVVGKQSDEEM